MEEKSGFQYLNIRKHIISNLFYPNVYLSIIYYLLRILKKFKFKLKWKSLLLAEQVLSVNFIREATKKNNYIFSLMRKKNQDFNPKVKPIFGN